MNFLVVDCETSGTRITDVEILTLHAVLLDDKLTFIKEEGFKFKPTTWKSHYDEAFEIHKISKITAMGFPDKEKELNRFVKWIPEKSILVCHSNKQNIDGFYAFDSAMLVWEFLCCDILGLYREKISEFVLSTHEAAQVLNRQGVINIPSAIKDGNKRASVDLSLKGLCKYFGIELNNHHDAKEDAWACYNILKKIYIIDPNIIETIKKKDDLKCSQIESSQLGTIPQKLKRSSKKN